MSDRRRCERVLVVDDDPDLLATLVDLLHLEDVSDVRTARTVPEAERLLAEGFAPQVIVLDLHLGGDRGEALAATLAATPAHCRIPIVALSGDHLALRRTAPAVARALLKPADPWALLQTIEELSGDE